MMDVITGAGASRGRRGAAAGGAQRHRGGVQLRPRHHPPPPAQRRYLLTDLMLTFIYDLFLLIKSYFQCWAAWTGWGGTAAWCRSAASPSPGTRPRPGPAASQQPPPASCWPPCSPWWPGARTISLSSNTAENHSSYSLQDWRKIISSFVKSWDIPEMRYSSEDDIPHRYYGHKLPRVTGRCWLHTVHRAPYLVAGISLVTRLPVTAGQSSVLAAVTMFIFWLHHPVIAGTS